MDWLDMEKPEEREKRELARLPQPEQFPNCVSYLRRCPNTAKIITVRDYSKRPKTTSQLAAAGKTKTHDHNYNNINKLETTAAIELTKEEEEEKLKERREMKVRLFDSVCVCDFTLIMKMNNYCFSITVELTLLL